MLALDNAQDIRGSPASLGLRVQKSCGESGPGVFQVQAGWCRRAEWLKDRAGKGVRVECSGSDPVWVQGSEATLTAAFYQASPGRGSSSLYSPTRHRVPSEWQGQPQGLGLGWWTNMLDLPVLRVCVLLEDRNITEPT